MNASLRRQLLWGILLPILAFVLLNSFSLYRQALRAADTAYDRTLLASAKAIGELLDVARLDGKVRLEANMLYSALEAFEADNRSRIFFKVTGFDGEMVSGFADLPPRRAELPANQVYAALVHFYDETYLGEPVRMAVLLQPVAGEAGQGMATIQVAETLELRRTLARQLLVQTAWQQLALLAVIALVVILVVQQATRPVRELRDHLLSRGEDDLSPLPAIAAPREMQPVVEAVNSLMARLERLIRHQKRFVRDAAHQLRTPLAVLKTQIQSAQRGDLPPSQALDEMAQTVAGATDLAQQMLALAKVEQLRQQGGPPVVDWSSTVRAVALDLSALVAERQLDFELVVRSQLVRAHEWALRELTRNLLHNAIRHSPTGAALHVCLDADGADAVLTISDEGPGLAPEMRERLFQPFARTVAGDHEGSGLGLAICHEIVQSLQGRISLVDRIGACGVTGLDAVVVLGREVQG